MSVQLFRLTYVLVLILASSLIICGCSKQPASVNAVPGEIAKEIARDVEFGDCDTEVLQHFTEGDKEVAIVLTKSKEQYTLWCVFRLQSDGEQLANGWKLWTNYVIMEDGTGAEDYAKREFSDRPDADAIASFRSEILDRDP